MKRRLLYTTLGALILLEVAVTGSTATGSLEYIVSMPEPHTHYFEVEIQLRNYDANFVDFKMPVWTPGSYLVREYAKNVEGFSAVKQDGSGELDFQKINKNTWRIKKSNDRNINIRYRIYAFEGSVRMSYLDENHAFIMANTLLMYVDDLKSKSSVLQLNIPHHWKNISTSLSTIEGNESVFYIPDYDILVDSPIEIGNHDILEFMAAGVPHEVAMSGTAYYDSEQIIRDLTKIVEVATAVFGENPNEKYTFIVHNTDSRGGGLEHMSSTVLGVDRWLYSNTQSYNGFLSLAAHEYFHLWLVKRLKPVELEVLDYDQEIYTELLWVMEGITSYYDEKIMLKGGFHSEQKFINNLLSAMATIRNTPGSREQSVAEASFDAWIKYYRKNENTDNTQISYYNKGMVLGALLDLIVINGSEGAETLDDVLRQLYYQYYKKKGKGITNSNLKKALEKAANTDLTHFFDDYVYGTKDLDYEKYLHFAGIGMIETNGSINSKSIGISFTTNGSNVILTSLARDGSAYENGLNVGDELISIDGFRVNHSNIHTIINYYKIGDRVTVLLSRGGLIVEKELDIRKNVSVNYTYELLADRSKQQVKVYNTWIGK